MLCMLKMFSYISWINQQVILCSIQYILYLVEREIEFLELYDKGFYLFVFLSNCH
jgi:TM2 domain-containing membrane protein YozV